MFQGTNLIILKGKPQAQYDALWFEYPAKIEAGENQNWRSVPKTEAVKDKNGNITGRRNIQWEGKDFNSIQPKEVAYEDLGLDTPEKADAYLKPLMDELTEHLIARYPGVDPRYSLLRWATKASDQETRSNFKPPMEISDAIKNVVDTFLRAGGFYDPEAKKMLKTKEELTEYFGKQAELRASENGSSEEESEATA